jgi:hypothetical protein
MYTFNLRRKSVGCLFFALGFILCIPDTFYTHAMQTRCIFGYMYCILMFCTVYIVKGTLTRDFRPLLIFHQTTPPRPLIHGLKPFWIWFRICGVNRQSWLHSSVMDTAVTCTAESLTPLWYAQQSHWHHCDMHSVAINTPVQQTGSKIFTNYPKNYCFLCGNMVRLHTAQRFHWQRCDMHSGVIDTAEQIWNRCDFGPHIPVALATFKGNNYRKRQIDLHYL